MFGWLFRKRLAREQAIALATEFLAANDCRVVASAAEADLEGDHIPVVFASASIPGRRWYVEFVRVRPPGVISTRNAITVYVWADTGLVTFDPFEGWESPFAKTG